MIQTTTEALLEFIRQSPSSFHAVENIATTLREKGYTELCEGSAWSLKKGGKYFVTRNRSSLLAFRIPKEDFWGFLLTASHSDSPCFKIKPEPEIAAEGGVVKLNVEKYGGMILSTWLDRPLSVAGRITVQAENGIETRLVNIDRDLLLMPSLAIHMNRAVNEGVALNPQKDMLPLFGMATEEKKFWAMIAQSAGVLPEDILGSDLFLYCRERGSIWGREGEFVSSPRLDDLQAVFATLQGFLAESEGSACPVYCVFDNEEVGSGTKQGAKSTFLSDVLRRINDGMGRTHEAYLQALASSMMLSADNGHAVHPNAPEMADPTHRPRLNGGVLIKYNANQKYTTDAVSDGIFSYLCQKAKIPTQRYVNRSDIAGGSTLGNLSGEQVSINTIDIGLAQLAMHSAVETAGAQDTDYLCRATEAFYAAELCMTADGNYLLES